MHFASISSYKVPTEHLYTTSRNDDLRLKQALFPFSLQMFNVYDFKVGHLVVWADGTEKLNINVYNSCVLFSVAWLLEFNVIRCLLSVCSIFYSKSLPHLRNLRLSYVYLVQLNICCSKRGWFPFD